MDVLDQSRMPMDFKAGPLAPGLSDPRQPEHAGDLLLGYPYLDLLHLLSIGTSSPC